MYCINAIVYRETTTTTRATAGTKACQVKWKCDWRPTLKSICGMMTSCVDHNKTSATGNETRRGTTAVVHTNKHIDWYIRVAIVLNAIKIDCTTNCWRFAIQKPLCTHKISRFILNSRVYFIFSAAANFLFLMASRKRNRFLMFSG